MEERASASKLLVDAEKRSRLYRQAYPRWVNIEILCEILLTLTSATNRRQRRTSNYLITANRGMVDLAAQERKVARHPTVARPIENENVRTASSVMTVQHLSTLLIPKVYQ